MKSKPVSESCTEAQYLVLPHDTNMLGTIFGGRIMEWIDTIAAIAAFRHAGKVAVTASMDSLHFISPVRLGDVVILKASLNYVRRTSMEIGVKVEAENPFTKERRHTASAYLTFVAIDENKKPSPIPALICESPEEKRRFQSGQKRWEARMQSRPKPNRSS